MGFLSGLLGLVPSVIGGAASFFGQKETNEANIELSRETQEFNAEQADVSRVFSANQAAMLRDWQEEMSSTSWQRGAKDMEAAGFNPMLAFSQGGASSPSGAQGNSSAASGPMASVSNPMAVAVQNAMQMYQMKTQLDNVAADTEVKKSQAVMNAASVPKIEQETRTSASSASQLSASAWKTSKEIDKVQEEIKNLQWEGRKLESEYERSRYEVIEILPLKRKLMQLEAQLGTAQVPRAQNEARAQDSWWMRHISPYLPDLLKGTSSAKSAQWFLD